MEQLRLEMRSTAFGAVLCELVEKRGIDPHPDEIGALAQEIGYDGAAVVERCWDAHSTMEFGDDLTRLAGRLQLTDWEMMRLAVALSFEKPVGEVITLDSCGSEANRPNYKRS